MTIQATEHYTKLKPHMWITHFNLKNFWVNMVLFFVNVTSSFSVTALSTAPLFTRGRHSGQLQMFDLAVFTPDALPDTTPTGSVFSPGIKLGDLSLVWQICKPLHCGAMRHSYSKKIPIFNTEPTYFSKPVSCTNTRQQWQSAQVFSFIFSNQNINEVLKQCWIPYK